MEPLCFYSIQSLCLGPEAGGALGSEGLSGRWVQVEIDSLRSPMVPGPDACPVVDKQGGLGPAASLLGASVFSPI